ncbi:inositol monophosphatase family protein [Parvibium lacunae]|uniref:Inositol-1-monophosphatase n=1 Tax=Parvibium lacunae TaxID=1888893 RepID=A0A368L770_9BURK|nr:inositol monophosphatase family protein [Parvibium lacunae]RCS59538.1 inositol monophosphatase [Parvibium lacunae]
MHPMLNTAVKAARLAGKIINRASLDIDLVKVSRKQQNDFVTEVDQAAEAAIIDTLLQAYPNHAILAEESGQSRSGQADSEYVWIIDPLDGTTNFIHGFPQYCISIGLQHRGQLTQAVVYDPSRDELFTASKGAGAYLNNKRIRVSNRTRMNEALIGTGFPFRDLDTLDLYLDMFRTITANSAGIRRPGAAALDLAYVACGRFDGFFEIGLMPWDIAAGSLLVQESGGLIGDFSGNSGYLEHGNVLAGTPKIFGQLVQLLEKNAGQIPADKNI